MRGDQGWGQIVGPGYNERNKVFIDTYSPSLLPGYHKVSGFCSRVLHLNILPHIRPKRIGSANKGL